MRFWVCHSLLFCLWFRWGGFVPPKWGRHTWPVSDVSSWLQGGLTSPGPDPTGSWAERDPPTEGLGSHRVTLLFVYFWLCSGPRCQTWRPPPELLALRCSEWEVFKSFGHTLFYSAAFTLCCYYQAQGTMECIVTYSYYFELLCYFVLFFYCSTIAFHSEWGTTRSMEDTYWIC